MLADRLQHREPRPAGDHVGPQQALVQQRPDAVDDVDLRELGHPAEHRLDVVQPGTGETGERARARGAPGSAAGRCSRRRCDAGSGGARAGPAGRRAARRGWSRDVSRSSCSENTRIRAAASSIPRGRPSSRRHTATASGTSASARVKPGTTAAARSTKRRTASLSAARRAASSPAAGSAMGGTGTRTSPRTRSASREVTTTVSPGQCSTRWASCAAAAVTCSKLSSTSTARRSPEVLLQGLQRRPVALVDTDGPGHGRPHPGRLALGAEVDPDHTVGPRQVGGAQGLQAEPGLARPARAGQGHQPGLTCAEEAAERREQLLAPHEGGGGDRQRLAERAGRQGRPGSVREALGQHQGQVVEHQLAQLLGVAERLVRRGVLLLQPLEQLAQAWLHVRRGPLDVDQPRHAPGEQQLVLQAGDLHVGGDPPVALPVDAEEDVRLLEVGLVEGARRVGAGAELEHHRGETQLLDRVPHGAALVGELAQRRGDEDAQALVGRADPAVAGAGPHAVEYVSEPASRASSGAGRDGGGTGVPLVRCPRTTPGRPWFGRCGRLVSGP